MMYEVTKKLMEVMTEKEALEQLDHNYDSVDRRAAEFKEDLAMKAWIEELSCMIDTVYDRVEYLYNHGKGIV